MLIRAVAETSTGQDVTEPALDDNENPPLDDSLRFREEDFEAVAREIRHITNAAGRRLRVATIPIATMSDQQSSHYDEIIDPDNARSSDVHVITNHILVQDRGIEDETQSSDHDAVLTNAVVEDRLLADYLHSRSQSHHENGKKRFRPQPGSPFVRFGSFSLLKRFNVRFFQWHCQAQCGNGKDPSVH